jgi:putative transposase
MYRTDIRLPSKFYFGTGIYFATICTYQRRRAFTSPALCGATIGILQGVSIDTGFMVHAYCLMPDHVHVLIQGTRSHCRLQTFISRWKQMTGFKFRDGSGNYFWQKGFYDCVLRKSGDIDSVAWYVWMNPVRAKIVRRPNEYPYSGSFTVPWPVVTSPRTADIWIPPWKTEGRDERVVERNRQNSRELLDGAKVVPGRAEATPLPGKGEVPLSAEPDRRPNFSARARSLR